MWNPTFRTLCVEPLGGTLCLEPYEWNPMRANSSLRVRARARVRLRLRVRVLCDPMSGSLYISGAPCMWERTCANPTCVSPTRATSTAGTYDQTSSYKKSKGTFVVDL